MTASLDASGRVVFHGGSDSEISAGVVAVLSRALSGLTPEELQQVWSMISGLLGEEAFV